MQGIEANGVAAPGRAGRLPSSTGAIFARNFGLRARPDQDARPADHATICSPN
jgi:hypothetical protein